MGEQKRRITIAGIPVNCSNNAPKDPTVSPLPCLTTAAGGGILLIEPFVVSPRHGREGAGPNPRAVGEPLPTITAGGSQVAIVQPFVLSQASCGAPRSVDDPIPTQTTGGNGGTHALISPYYGSGSGETCTGSDAPLPTVTSKGRFGMVVPVCQSNGGAAARDVAEPLPTMTTAKGGEFAVVMPDGGTVYQHARDRVEIAYAEGTMPPLLPSFGSDKS